MVAQHTCTRALTMIHGKQCDSAPHLCRIVNVVLLEALLAAVVLVALPRRARRLEHQVYRSTYQDQTVAAPQVRSTAQASQRLVSSKTVA